MSKSPRRKASGNQSRKPATIELKAEKSASADKSADTKSTTGKTAGTQSSARSTPKVGRDANKPDMKPKVEAKAETVSKTDAKSSSEPKRDDVKKTAPQPSPVSKTPTQNTKSGGMGRIAAGIVGGAIALGGGAALQYSDVLPSLNRGAAVDTSQLASVAAVEETNAELNSRIAELSAKLEALPAQQPTVDMAQIESAIEQRLAAVEAPQLPDDVTQQIAAMTERTAALETSLSETKAAMAELAESNDEVTPNPVFGAVSDKVDIVAGDLAKLKQDLKADLSQERVNPQDFTALQENVSGLSTTLSEVQSAVSTVTTGVEALPENVVGGSLLDEKLAGVTSQISTVSETLESQKTALATLEERVGNGADKRAAKALIAAQLKGEVDRGESFSATLDTWKASSGDAETYAPIEPYAADGIPTLDNLAAQFDAVSEKILDATTPVESMSLTDRLLSGAKSLVKVKPIGAVEGDGVNAIVSRIDASLQTGDGAQAAVAWDTLPQAGKDVSADWHKALQSRVTANNLLNSTVQNFISSTVSN